MFWDVGLYRSIDSSLGLMVSVTAVLTVYVSSAPVGDLLVKGLSAASSILWPDETRSRLYVPSVDGETVMRYVSPEPEMLVTGLLPLFPLPVLPEDRTKSDAVTPVTSSLNVTS